MANIKQQMKRNLTNNKRKLQNASFKTSIKTAVKAVEKAVSEKNLELATTGLALASKKLDKAVSKGFLHKNNVARQKSRLFLLVNSIK
ncbi:MAG: 30S ribosomal protein S20 [Bacilli bacterium]|jgi:small subunit ribosomal protein S20|nr:30S ribosomal protein S20 [Bacilli bacterium]MDY0064103.1 30S ribosomal protein S20 [Bacilli bacterium]